MNPVARARESESRTRASPLSRLALPPEESRAVRDRLHAEALAYVLSAEEDGEDAPEFLPGPILVVRGTIFPQTPRNDERAALAARGSPDSGPRRVVWIDPLIERPDGKCELLQTQCPSVSAWLQVAVMDEKLFDAIPSFSALGEVLLRRASGDALREGIAQCIARGEAALIAAATRDSDGAVHVASTSASSANRRFPRAL